MAEEFINLLKKKFDLNEAEINLMGKTMRRLTREDRKYFFKSMKPKEKIYKEYLSAYYQSLEPEQKTDFIEITVNSLLAKGGEPDIADSMAMGVAGRIPVYNRMREKAENEGLKLNLLANFGGIGTVIMLVGGITAIILYLLAK
ncbi:hypothetical protein SAMN05660649_01646 [Desulfotomaculum arcticum]|uniref:Uncharacterized protein n=1 Tax=Desulfotruncus arcticus DSM 17038 TaxID=1121424 RepID=A0A1I2RXA8_9FIRM|nr:hypothetical protein [Desulfotruncus arcticus]SFG44713.1 hypothetical protein SAMN05660649_01646 [Desulfotomaculum arcticum] [Desulfotruncus arcticus DSM 17038]